MYVSEEHIKIMQGGIVIWHQFRRYANFEAGPGNKGWQRGLVIFILGEKRFLVHLGLEPELVVQVGRFTDVSMGPMITIALPLGTYLCLRRSISRCQADLKGPAVRTGPDCRSPEGSQGEMTAAGAG